MNIAVLVDAIKSFVIIAYGRSAGIAVDVCEGGAISERRASNALYGVGDGYGGEGGATLERIASNACYGVWDGYGGERGATTERRASNARYGVGGAVVGNGFGDDGFGSTNQMIDNFHGVTTRDVVGQVAGLEIVGESRCCGA